MNLLIAFGILFCICVTYGQQQPFLHNTIWEAMNKLAGNETFYQTLNDPKFNHSFRDTLSNTTTNHTLFLPSQEAIQLAQTNNLFSTKNTTKEQLLYHILNNQHDPNTLHLKRHYYSTLSSVSPLIIISPKDNTSIQIFAGPTVSNVIGQHYQCNNGIIYRVDGFLLSPLSPLDTVSFLPELELTENLIKSQNLSNIISTQKRTIFAPINSAWDAYGGIDLPFGTIVHDLQYHVVKGLYFKQDLMSHNYTLLTDYASTVLDAQNYANRSIIIASRGVSDDNGAPIPSTIIQANVVRTDVLTTNGIIHLIDQILVADPIATLLN